MSYSEIHKIRRCLIMKKVTFGMISSFIFEADERISECNNIKEAIEKGFLDINITELTLLNPDGSEHTDEDDIKVIKQALIFGLKEKG
jgi:hypothetical protein